LRTDRVLIPAFHLCSKPVRLFILHFIQSMPSDWDFEIRHLEIVLKTLWVKIACDTEAETLAVAVEGADV
jgi:hypothetical protein